MLENLKFISDLFVDFGSGRRNPELAKFCAYILAPSAAFVLAAGFSGGHGLGLDLLGPVTVSELRSEISSDGTTRSRPGIAVIIEPSEAEVRIPIAGGTPTIWSSLDESTLRVNQDRLQLDSGGFRSRTPLFGVDAPVAVVLEGRLGESMQVVGGSDPMEDWTLPARRGVSILSSILLACVFAFGMAFVAAIPSVAAD